MNLRKILVLVVVVLSSLNCARSQTTPANVRHSFYIDHSRHFSIEVLPNVDSESTVMFLGASPGFYTVLITTIDVRADLARYHKVNKRDLIAQGMKVTLDSEITFRGRKSILWRYQGVLRGQQEQVTELSVVSKNRLYNVLVACPSQCNIARMQELLFNFRCEQDAPVQLNDTLQALYVDSLRQFSFCYIPEKRTSDDSDAALGVFYGPTKSAFLEGVTKRIRTTREGWRTFLNGTSDPSFMTLVSDSDLSVDGRESFLRRTHVLWHGAKSEGLLLAVIDSDRVYSWFAVCPEDQYARYESAIRNTLLTFKLF